MFNPIQIIIGLVMVILGVLMTRFAFWLRNLTGPQMWMEQYTGSGSTYGMYKILGVFVGIIGFLIMTGLMNGIMEAIMAPIGNMFGGVSGARPTPTPFVE